jgi:hypothetical protein
MLSFKKSHLSATKTGNAWKTVIKIFLFFYTMVFLLGCASVRMASKEEDTALKEFKLPPPDRVGLYIFRNSFLGQALTRPLYVDGNLIGETANGVYFYVDLSPGKHFISTESEFGKNSVVFEAEAGKNYFAEQYIKMGIFSGGSDVEMVDEKVGMQQVLECELAETKAQPIFQLKK